MNKATDKQQKAHKRNWMICQVTGMITTLENHEKNSIDKDAVALYVEIQKAKRALQSLQREISESDVESWKA